MMADRKPLWWQMVLHAVIPGCILLVLGWGASRIETMGKTLVIVEHNVVDIKEKLDQHQNATQQFLDRNSELHHNRSMKTPCNGCHFSKD